MTHSPSPALRGWHQYLELKLVSLTGRADILYFSWGMKLLPPPTNSSSGSGGGRRAQAGRKLFWVVEQSV